MAGIDLQKLFAAAQEAYTAGFYQQAARILRQARQVAEENRDERRRVTYLFWEGESLRNAGDIEGALPLFLQAAEATSPDVEPADVFNGMAQVLNYARSHRSAAFSRKLLCDLWRHLERLGKERWGHKLHALEGDLLFAQGNFEAALKAQEKGWASYVGGYPCFTEASHLWSLCTCTFALKDTAGLAKWVDAIEANQAVTEWDRIAASLGRLLLLRTSESRMEAATVAVEIARSILRRVEAMELEDLGTEFPPLRVLALFNNHDEVTTRLDAMQPTDDSDHFDHRLLQGDLGLCRARAHLGMEARDDEWDDYFPPPVPPITNHEGALRQLTSARQHFEAARTIAEREDERLDTTYYSSTLNSRIDRVDVLNRCVEAKW